jgi:hypothetical protein
LGLLLTDPSLNFISVAASLVYAFTVPYAAIQPTLYYFDLDARGVAIGRRFLGHGPRAAARATRPDE